MVLWWAAVLWALLAGMTFLMVVVEAERGCTGPATVITQTPQLLINSGPSKGVAIDSLGNIIVGDFGLSYNFRPKTQRIGVKIA